MRGSLSVFLPPLSPLLSCRLHCLRWLCGVPGLPPGLRLLCPAWPLPLLLPRLDGPGQLRALLASPSPALPARPLQRGRDLPGLSLRLQDLLGARRGGLHRVLLRPQTVQVNLQCCLSSRWELSTTPLSTLYIVLSGSFLSGQGNSCISCPHSCRTCDGRSCNSCQPRYFLQVRTACSLQYDMRWSLCFSARRECVWRSVARVTGSTPPGWSVWAAALTVRTAGTASSVSPVTTSPPSPRPLQTLLSPRPAPSPRQAVPALSDLPGPGGGKLYSVSAGEWAVHLHLPPHLNSTYKRTTRYCTLHWLITGWIERLAASVQICQRERWRNLWMSGSRLNILK